MKEIKDFIVKLLNGFDLVIGSRLKGKIQKGAMPFWHRYVGTPVLNFLFKFFFRQNISDINSGFRAITREAFDKLKLSSTGMEFASEMVYKAGKLNLKIAEVPITYQKRIGESKLSPFRDAWRHLKFMLLFSSTFLFVVPGVALGGLGGLGMIWLLPGPQTFGGRVFDFHTMIVSAFLLLLGFQIVFLGLFAKVFAMNFLAEENRLAKRMVRVITLEKGILAGVLVALVGAIGTVEVLLRWWQNSFGALADERLLLFGLTLFVLGVEIIFSSFFFGLIGKEER
ncbi:glycosyltransferase family 2 protein [Candidatus Gottesmanbacteria bacterium]|nr:glycosyltransferase family 2 protein [Candidatus Gottesmanbacteria bacterium]